METTLDAVHDWVKEIAGKLSSPVRKDVGYLILTSVLHNLRDELDLQEMFQFSNQLPSCVRGVFFEGYDPERVPVVMYNQTFLDSYHARMGPGNSKYLENHLLNNHHHTVDVDRFIESVSTNLGSETDVDPRAAVEAVLNVLREKTSVVDLDLGKVNSLMEKASIVSVQE